MGIILVLNGRNCQIYGKYKPNEKAEIYVQ